MRISSKLSIAVLALVSVSLGVSCSRAKPPARPALPTWQLQPMSENASYENKSWNIDTEVLINNQPANREEAMALTHRLKGTYEAVLPNGGGESNVISGFWQRDVGADLTIQIWAGGKERLPAGTKLKVTIRDTESDRTQLLVLGLDP